MKIVKLILLCAVFFTYHAFSMRADGASSSNTEPFDQCCICQYDLDPSIAAIVSGTHFFASPPCSIKHQFHLVCINACLEHACRQCPLCRAAILAPEERDLLEAVRTGNAAAITAAINAGAHFDINHGEVLRTAIASRHFEVACDYIHRYAKTPSVDWQIPNMLAVLFYALQHNRVEVVRDFSNAHFSLTELIAQLLTRNQFDQVQQLVERKRKILPTAILLTKEQLQSLLCEMASGGFAEAVQWLYDRYSGTHPAFETALRMAVLNGHIAVVQYLAAQNPQQKLLTHFAELAAQTGRAEVLQHLLQTYHLDYFPLEQMLIASTKAGHVDIVQYLSGIPDLHAHIIDVIHIALEYDCPDHRVIMRNLMINQPENIAVILEKITMHQDTPNDLDRAIIAYLVENKQLNQRLIDETTARALENQRNDIARYLIDGRHTHLRQALLFAQCHQWHRAIDILITQYSRELNLEEAFIDAVELNSHYTLSIMRQVEPHLQIQALLLAAQHNRAASLETLLPRASQEILSAALLHAASLNFLSAVEIIVRHFISRNPLNATLHHELICRAVQAGHLETVRFLIENLHFDGSLDQAIRWAHLYGKEQIEQYFTTNHGDKIDIPAFVLWARTISHESGTSTT